MFDKILIANRGEIACRVARTARRLAIRTVAIYSDADVRALHVGACDESYRVGRAPPRESYLAGDRIIDIARRAGVQAIHPGYGFLSENAEFAAACEAAGIVFIGPPAAAIAAMGSKAAAKAIMGQAGVPLVPGYHGDDQHPQHLAHAAAAIGYPVLIKASAGGGGKGMRIVEHPEEFQPALAAARRESKAAFGDDRVLVEKYLTAPRHIEVQIFADRLGNAVHLFERDCSVQRRHQKVLEEAPAPGVTTDQRERLGAAAVAAARAIGYVGAGTVEFIAPPSFATEGTFYFMEMNTRLQVEHPVTEMITGTDLVEWQLRVAAGEPLPRGQEALAMAGHAIEARVYAEDPERGFLPSIGRIAHWRVPPPGPDLRIEAGVRAGDDVAADYDPMLAKVIVHGAGRDEAVRKLGTALEQLQVAGVTTNVSFLRRLLGEGAFARGEIDTGLIGRRHAALFPPPRPLPQAVLVAASLAELSTLEARARASAAPDDPFSPWCRGDAWWLNSRSHALRFEWREHAASDTAMIVLRRKGEAWTVRIDDGDTAEASIVERHGPDLRFVIADREYGATVIALGEERVVFGVGEECRLQLVDRLAHAGEHEVREGHLRAPMSGTIVAVFVAPGAAVAKGAPLVVLEAMKMEHTITAPGPGRIAAVHFGIGDRVQEGADLVELDVASD